MQLFALRELLFEEKPKVFLIDKNCKDYKEQWTKKQPKLLHTGSNVALKLKRSLCN